MSKFRKVLSESGVVEAGGEKELKMVWERDASKATSWARVVFDNGPGDDQSLLRAFGGQIRVVPRCGVPLLLQVQ